MICLLYKRGEDVKRLLEGIKDFIYDSIDYIVMIAIVVAVVFVIGWRLDVLFAKDTYDMPNPPTTVVDNDLNDDLDKIDENEDDDDNVIDESDELADNNSDPNSTDNEEAPDQGTDIVDNPEQPTVSSPITVTINIPDGTLPSGIGAILESNGLVESKNDFVIKAQDMGLDRRLRSGTFKIQDNSSLEEIIKIIARQN